MNPFAAHSSSNPSPPSKKEIGLPAKFSYSFQPSILPSYLPLPNNGTRTAMNVGLGYTPLPKPNMLYKKP